MKSKGASSTQLLECHVCTESYEKVYVVLTQRDESEIGSTLQAPTYIFDAAIRAHTMRLLEHFLFQTKQTTPSLCINRKSLAWFSDYVSCDGRIKIGIKHGFDIYYGQPAWDTCTLFN